MNADFRQADWDAQTVDDCRHLVRLAVREDLDHGQDWTTLALIAPEQAGAARLNSRQTGVACGMRAVEVVLNEMETELAWSAAVNDGDRLEPGDCLGELRGPVQELLTCERLVLNLVGRLSGIASLTARYVAAAKGQAAIYDTRKTTPGWRRLEKFAVRCGGGHNHRTGLFDAILIKDNHLAAGPGSGQAPWEPAAAVAAAREFLGSLPACQQGLPVEVEVDSLGQLAGALTAAPDIILLDNMGPELLRQAVVLRDQRASGCVLEASGGITLETLPEVAATGIDRISVGALTHAAVSLDVGLDWSFDSVEASI